MSSEAEPGKGTSRDIQPRELSSLRWGPEHAPQSLVVIYEHAVSVASDAIEWYSQNKRPKPRSTGQIAVLSGVLT